MLLFFILATFVWTALVVLRAVWSNLPPVIWLGDRWLRIRTRLIGPPRPEVWTPLNDGSGLYFNPGPAWRRWLWWLGRILGVVLTVLCVLAFGIALYMERSQ